MGEVCYSLLDGQPDRQLLDALRAAIAEATSIEIAVSFVKRSGVNLIIDDLESALRSGRCKNLSILTSDYMSITDPFALKRLLSLLELGADIRLHNVPAGQSFHLKTYLFLCADNTDWRHAEAFVGSSNLSRPALTDGLEWNYRVRWPDPADTAARLKIEEIRQRFYERFDDDRVVPLTWAAIQAYEAQRHKIPIVYLRPDPEELDSTPPSPRVHQQRGLQALANTREEGFKRGLVVLATGLGKTWLAAFDVKQMAARKVLFVAHREEILKQAQDAFLQVLPDLRPGFYSGKKKDTQADMLFASVQALGKDVHLSRFKRDQFDYIVIDEFHHAAAASYQRLINYFNPQFMLGLTATPDRGDRYNILGLCDDNLVYQMDLFDGIRGGHLVPFNYYGIFDKDVDYTHIPWRSGRFDSEALTQNLATRQRACHALKEWRERAGRCTLAFCSSRQHADFMADYFRQKGVAAASVYAGSALGREAALSQLESGELSVLFAVDLFNEGMDLPAIDTIMMLRPTESSILFLQQLGRGLRLSADKEHLVVLDFVANHSSFLNRPELLSEGIGLTLAQKLRKIVAGERLLPDGCFVQYDIEFIEFLNEYVSLPLERAYFDLKRQLDHRPDLKTFCQQYPDMISRLRTAYKNWWSFLDRLDELSADELEVLGLYEDWFNDLTVTNLSKSFKLILLKNWLVQGPGAHVGLDEMSSAAKNWFCEHPEWQTDLAASVMPVETVPSGRWRTYWKNNPVKAWSRPERGSGKAWFIVDGDQFKFSDHIEPRLAENWRLMTEAILEWRLSSYQQSRLATLSVPPSQVPDESERIPFFTSLEIACGHFRSAEPGEVEMVVPEGNFGRLDPARHFLARAKGNSMNGGKNPVCDGDLLLLELITPQNAGRISGQVVAIECQNMTGDDQYLLRNVVKQEDGAYLLRAFNSAYSDMTATEEMQTFARLKAVLHADDLK